MKDGIDPRIPLAGQSFGSRSFELNVTPRHGEAASTPGTTKMGLHSAVDHVESVGKCPVQSRHFPRALHDPDALLDVRKVKSAGSCSTRTPSAPNLRAKFSSPTLIPVGLIRTEETQPIITPMSAIILHMLCLAIS